jgi:glycolate oxidase FAD binding subunit
MSADAEARILEAIRSSEQVLLRGGGSKPALSGAATLVLDDLSGLLEYDPGEYTFTALAATPITEVEAALAEHGQYLPFDPPLAAAGATLGGTVAAGLSGPGRFRYGGVRDFLLGVRFADGRGQLLTGGGKVVKNAAGFDLPKAMVGSLGRFGVLLELTFKVFPKPERHATLRADFASDAAAQPALAALALAPHDLSCLEFEPPARLWLRVGGLAAAQPARIAALTQLLEARGGEVETFTGPTEAALWRELGEFAWVPAGQGLVKVPLTPTRVGEIEAALAALEPPLARRYGVGGNVLWLAWPEALGAARLEVWLQEHGLAAMAVTGRWQKPLLGPLAGEGFARRVAAVLDPEGKFRLPAASVRS